MVRAQGIACCQRTKHILYSSKSDTDTAVVSFGAVVGFACVMPKLENQQRIDVLYVDGWMDESESDGDRQRACTHRTTHTTHTLSRVRRAMKAARERSRPVAAADQKHSVQSGIDIRRVGVDFPTLTLNATQLTRNKTRSQLRQFAEENQVH